MGHNLHSEEHELNLMSFPSILHLGPSSPPQPPSLRAFSGRSNRLAEDSRRALQCRGRPLGAEREVPLYGVVTGCTAAIAAAIRLMANNMLIGARGGERGPQTSHLMDVLSAGRESHRPSVCPDETCQGKFSDKALLTIRPQSASGKTKDNKRPHWESVLKCANLLGVFFF